MWYNSQYEKEVKRGVCFGTSELERIDESLIEKIDNKYIRTSLETGAQEEISGDTYVSMNLLGFSNGFVDYLSSCFKAFLEKNKADLSTKEFGIPDAIEKLLEDGSYTFKIIDTDEKWYGMTYREDKQMVVDAINEMVASGIYKENLWKN